MSSNYLDDLKWILTNRIGLVVEFNDKKTDQKHISRARLLTFLLSKWVLQHPWVSKMVEKSMKNNSFVPSNKLAIQFVRLWRFTVKIIKYTDVFFHILICPLLAIRSFLGKQILTFVSAPVSATCTCTYPSTYMWLDVYKMWFHCNPLPAIKSCSIITCF